MERRDFLQLDVVADRPGAGNALAVVLDARGLDSASMQAIAAWTNLSETTFVLPPVESNGSYRVRIFTPRQELPFAGHPSVGTAHAVLESGLAAPQDGLLWQECGAGVLPLRVQGEAAARRIHVRAPRRRVRHVSSDWQDALARAVHGMALGALPPALYDNGPWWWLVELRTASDVRALQPDLVAIAELTRLSGAVGLAVFGRAQVGQDHSLAVRAFCPADAIPEDPVTGSANALIAAYLHDASALQGIGRQYIASQGREIGRDGRIEVEIDASGEIWIGGQTQTVVRGTLDW